MTTNRLSFLVIALFILSAHQKLNLRASVIPLCVILLVLDSAEKKQSLNVKKLMASLPFSSMGIRNHLRYLIGRGLLALQEDPLDQRRKLILPTKRLLNAIQNLTQ